MNKKVKLLSVFLISAAAIILVLWQLFFAQTISYYVISAVVMLLFLIPFFAEFEKSGPSAREMALTAVLIALAVVSRAVFYLVPQFKPIGAVVIVSAVCLGACKGCVIGAFSAFASNFIFGQGLHTPFQMAALGLTGFLAGLIFDKIKAIILNLSLLGFLLTAVLYGLIVDLSSVLTLTDHYSLSSVLAVYAAGMPFSLAFGGATAVFLFLFGEQFVRKIKRIIIKYGIIKD